MPFPKWAVEPVFLVRKPLPPDKNEPCNFYPIINASLVSCLRQLASVAKIADRIFDEIGCECRQIAERTQRLKDKIHTCNEIVSNFNARAVQVPVSDLNTTARFLRSEKPFITQHEQSTQLFLPSTRPPCVDSLYGLACATPVPLMCTIDRYRTDGLSASDLFMVTPVLGGEGKKMRRLLDIETRKPANFSLVATNQDRIESGSASLPPMVLPSRGYILKQNESLELERLPSPEEQAMLVSLEYPSTIVPVDTSGASFSRMSLMRRSLIHVDFVIKHRKSKKKRSKRRHTFCEGQNRELDQAIRNVTNTSCQTDDTTLDTTASSTSTLMRMSLRRRSRSVQDNSRRLVLDDLDGMGQEGKDSATEEEKEATPTKSFVTSSKKSLRSLAQGFNSSLSAAISAVKMRGSTRKQDDGRSSSGNWSASSSTRASVDSSDHPAATLCSPSRSSLGKDSLLSDATQQDMHNRSRDDILPIQMLTHSPVKKKKFAHMGLPWETNRNRTSNTPTPELTSNGTPLVRSPYAGRRGVSDDGDSSVYSVDTDGYYTSMHTDSGLWCNAVPDLKSEDVLADLAAFRQRKESQSSVSTNDNSSINSFLSKSATECSSNSDSFKLSSCPQPPVRVSSCKNDAVEHATRTRTNADFSAVADVPAQELEDSDKSYSPHPPNGSNSESEHEVRDRIRYKTAITPHRYPSMCAVSPETSDDEIADLKRRTVVPNVNVVVAEIHQEEVVCDSVEETETRTNKTDIEQVPKPNSQSQSPGYLSSAINMYRCETPVPSNFSSSILCSQPVGSSTPRSGVSITTFSPEFNDTINPNTKGSHFETANNALVAYKPDSPLPKTDKSLIPLKYAQRITVTPIARNDSSSGCTGTIKRTPMKQIPSNETRTEKQSLLPSIKTDAAPSYVSFKAPDSPVSSLTSFKMGPEGKVTSPTGSLSRPIASPTGSLSRPVASPTGSLSRVVASPTGSLSRPVARVTLDPTGKVVYASNSLERSRTVSPSQGIADQQSYATLPMYQSNVVPRSTTPIGNQYTISANERSMTPVSHISTPPVNNRSTTPTINRATTPVNNRSTTPVNNRSSTPVDNRSTTPVNNRSTTTVNNRSTTPITIRAITPVNNRSATSLNNRSTTPVNNRSTTPVNNRSTTPVNRSTTPVNNRSTTPVNNRSTTPVNNRSTTPVVNISAVAVNNRYTTPINNRDIISDSNRSTNIVNDRVPTAINSAPTNNRSMSARPIIPIVTRCTTRMRDVQNRVTSDSMIPKDPNDGFDKTVSKISMQPLPDQKQPQQYQFSSFKSSNAGTDFNFRPSRGGRFCRSYFPSHLISPPSGQTPNGSISSTTTSPSSSPAAVRQSHDAKLSPSPSHDYSAGRNYPIASQQTTLRSNQIMRQPSSFQPNPSGYVPNPQSDNPRGQSSSNTIIWPNRYHTPPTNNIYSGSNPKSDWVKTQSSGSPNSVSTRTDCNSSRSLSPPDLIPSGQSPPSTLDVTSSTRQSFRTENPSKEQDGDKKNIKSLSANELFAIIHSSKKKHNIKSESELSMSPMSSRSVSPALSQSSTSRLQPVESGVLSRRYDNPNSPDRSKWCNSLPSSKKFPEKLGPTKPTSMRDFKMLLLQTRTGSQDSIPRPSAAELLKVSPPKSSTPPVPSVAFKSPATYTSPVGTYSPGHGTVPLKRSMRTRSPYMTRYDSAYPPIIEDCSEEMESYEDSKCLSSNNLPYKTINNNNYEPSSPQSSTKKATSTWV